MIILEDLFDEAEFDNMETQEELEETVEKRMDEYNRSSQGLLGGLSPLQKGIE